MMFDAFVCHGMQCQLWLRCLLKAAARKLKSEGDTDKEALKIMNLQCPNCRDVFFFDTEICIAKGALFFLDMDGLGMAWL